jgi:integrase
MGRLFFGELLEAALASAEDPRGKSARGKTPEVRHGCKHPSDITADSVELYLRNRLRQRVRIKSSLGIREMNALQPATVHQEFRVLRRMLNVAVRKRPLPANPCAGVEFPVRVKGLFRPHYVSWSEQKRIEQHAQPHLRNIVRIITETGLRVYKELTPMKKIDVDLANAMVWIPVSKTPNGIAEVPSPLWRLMPSRISWQLRDRGRSCFQATETSPDTR